MLRHAAAGEHAAGLSLILRRPPVSLRGGGRLGNRLCALAYRVSNLIISRRVFYTRIPSITCMRWTSAIGTPGGVPKLLPDGHFVPAATSPTCRCRLGPADAHYPIQGAPPDAAARMTRVVGNLVKAETSMQPRNYQTDCDSPKNLGAPR
jgi:hypothetical protein